jgi:hypothetical protein
MPLRGSFSISSPRHREIFPSDGCASPAANTPAHRQSIARHGEVSKEYIDYNRRDVLATFELAEKLLEEYEKHPIQATKACSPGSVGKAYLRAMGINPTMPDLAAATSSVNSVRSSALIRPFCYQRRLVAS